MRAVPQKTITDAILVNAGCAEPATGEVVWSGATTYAKENRVISTSTHRTYKSLLDGNLNHPLPAAGVKLNDWWIDDGPTIAWAAFDLDRSTGTTVASPYTIVVDPDEKLTSLCLFGIDADQVEIEMTRGADVLYSETVQTRYRKSRGWLDFFTKPWSRKTSIVRHTIPQRSGVRISVTFTKATGSVTLGSYVIGRSVYMGAAQYGAELGRLNFSKIDRDDDGNATLTRKKGKRKLSLSVRTPAALIDVLDDLLEKLDAVPTVWLGIDDEDHPYFSGLALLGIYRDATPALDRADSGLTALTFEEV